MKISLFLIAVVGLAYIAGVKFPGPAKMIGL